MKQMVLETKTINHRPSAGGAQIWAAPGDRTISKPTVPIWSHLEYNVYCIEENLKASLSPAWSASSSPLGVLDVGGRGELDKAIDGDPEGVWSPDIEQSFQEALAIYPPCGRRKIILSEEGKMYGRNELIARYIKLQTGKVRSRKQVSSHIQVLARKKSREYVSGIKVSSHLQVLARRKNREVQSKLKDQASKEKAIQNMAALSSAQIVSPSIMRAPPPSLARPTYPTSGRFWHAHLSGQLGPSEDIKPFAQTQYPSLHGPVPSSVSVYEPPAPPLAASVMAIPVWQDRTIASSRLRLLEYCAFMELHKDTDTVSKHEFVHIGQSNLSCSDPVLETVDVQQIYDKFPDKKGGLKDLYEWGPRNTFFLVKFWADLSCSGMQDGPDAFYGVNSVYSSSENMTITVSTKVCSFGKQVVEKVEVSSLSASCFLFPVYVSKAPPILSQDS
ncbi:hypothetical protein GJAV_G00171500 [Gymnothorax javanicus]|nr:hypothetical protein GJAV_G00171500 [Gymnothorax javanicus]